MNETERDRRIDAAWNATSREQPPPALDAAIRAAARRAVDAAPGRKRNKHWWYPLASAAMVAVLAVAIVQLTPPEQVAPTVVADMSAAPSAAPQEVAPPAAPIEKAAAEPPSASVDSTAPAPSPQQAPARRAQAAATGSLARERGETPAIADDAKKQAYAAKRELAAQDKLASAKPDRQTTDAAAPSSAPVAAPPPPAVAAPPSASVAAGAPASVPPSEPFPARPAPESRRDQYAEERKPAANAMAGAATRQAESPAAPSAQDAQIKSRVAMAKITASDEAKAKDVSGRSLDEWIKRIRELKREGRTDEAAKELAAFRTAYGERADALLPADLREAK